MTLRPATELFARARAGGYALGYFESWNLESLQGALDAVEQTRSPAILGFNGEFLTGPDRLAPERIELYAGLGRAAAESATVPCCLFFNECPSDRHVWQAVESGFNLVMLADPHASLEDYTQRVARLVQYAHTHGAAVEAELGELPSGAQGAFDPTGSSSTDPEQALRFIAATHADLLAVSVGNVHVLLDGELALDLERLAEIQHQLNMPLSLHGGTGIPVASLREAIGLGVAKVAYGTYLKQRYLEAVRYALGSDELNPHRLLGIGGPEDVLVAARYAVRDAVLERIEFLGCCGKA